MPYDLPAFKTRQNLDVVAPVARVTSVGYNVNPLMLSISYSMYPTMADAYADPPPDPLNSGNVTITKDKQVISLPVLSEDGLTVITPGFSIPSMAQLRSDPEVAAAIDGFRILAEKIAKKYDKVLKKGTIVPEPAPV